MKPIHLAALGAVLAVAAILYFALGGDGDSPSRTRPAREAPTRRPVDFDEFVPTEPPAPGTTYGFELALKLPGGGAAAGAEVRVAGRTKREGKADASGRVKLDGLEPGHYDLWARSGKAAGALGFSLHSDRDLGALTLRVAVTVRGRVFDVNKRPLPGATVEAVAVERGGGSWIGYSRRLASADTIAAQARAGADGAYELLLPGRGRYGLRAWAAGFAAEVEGTADYDEDRGGVDFYLLPGRTLNGRVVNDAEMPVAGARVVAAVFAGRPGDIAPKVHAVTPPDGTFRVTVPNAVRVHLSVTAAGYAKYTNPRVQLTGRELTVRLQRGVAVRLRTLEKASQRPVAGVEVSVRYQGGVRTARSDDAGDVVIENLPTLRATDGTGLTLMVVPVEFVPQRISLRDVEVVDGALDVGAVELERGGIVRGTVRDKESGQPVAGASVRPFGGRSIRLSTMLSADVRTDGDGRYELKGVPLDAGTIVAFHDDYVMDPERDLLMKHLRGGTLFRDGATEATVDIELNPATAVRGVVLGPNGDPVAGARIENAAPTRTSLIRLVGGEEPVAISDARGRFALPGLVRGESATLFATHRDYGASDRVEGVAGERDVTLRLAPPLTIRGLVVDEGNRPVAGVRVSVTAKRDPASRLRSGGTRPGYTADDGTFAVRNAPTGELTISFDHRAYATLKREIALDGGRPVHELGRVRLTRGPGIEILVVRPDGTPAVNVRVNASWAGKPFGVAGNRTRPDGRTFGNAVSDENGRADIYGLAEGPFRITVIGNRHFSDKPIVRTGSRDVRLVVREAATLRGRVVSGGKGVHGAWVRALLKLERDEQGPSWTNLIATARTNRDGAFTLNGLPPDAPFDLTISHRDYLARDVIGVRAGTGREFELEGGGRIAGIVADSGGPVSGATIRVLRNGAAVKFGRSDAQGRFQFSGLGGGTIEVHVSRTEAGHIPGEPVTVQPGDLNIRIEVKRGLTIGGRIVFADTKGRVGAMVEVVDADGQVAGTTWVTAERPEFTLRGLRPGTYTVRVVRWFERNREQLAELPGIGAGTNDVEIEVR